jgi:hypothetical protein
MQTNDEIRSIYAELTDIRDETQELFEKTRARIQKLRDLYGENSQVYREAGEFWDSLSTPLSRCSGLDVSLSDSDGIFIDSDCIGSGSSSVGALEAI